MMVAAYPEEVKSTRIAIHKDFLISGKSLVMI